MGKGDTPHDLRRAYPQLEPDREYPPLHLQSLKGKVSAAEWEARVDCACAYRLVKHFGMDDLIYNHISARIPGTEEFLLNPMGLTYDEICASSLIKVDLKGNVLWEPEFPKGLGYKFNLAGFVIHGASTKRSPSSTAWCIRIRSPAWRWRRSRRGCFR